MMVNIKCSDSLCMCTNHMHRPQHGNMLEGTGCLPVNYAVSTTLLSHCLKPQPAASTRPYVYPKPTIRVITASTVHFENLSISCAQYTTSFQVPFNCHRTRSEMVCAKCQRLQMKTELVTPSVKHKSDLYFGSPASHDRSKSSATSNASGVAKVS